MEFVLAIAAHIDNPCEVEIEPGQIENIRKFWIQEAKNALGTITIDVAREILIAKIKEYESEG